MKIAKNMPQQENNYDCGVFTILYAKFLNENKSEHFTQMDIPYYRRWLFKFFLNKN
uniref:Ubiquitin-like protease family profile domain-containing protein n=1 Tax=Meloidogyne incognita TaxID=6306 RepID=A0A914LJG8_MELIC